ncbi:MAG: stage II sporulation protein M [Planctomycetota bacterium]|jgi:uncharacterized membrane protein SpoIIM required for sporulation|nr:stage II sporulation protein M [Planctomycetota bacterium]
MTPELRFHLRATAVCYALFLLGTGIGWTLIRTDTLSAEMEDPSLYTQNARQVLSAPSWDNFTAILSNNILSLLAMLAGAVTIGLLPLFQTLHIGITIGIEMATKLKWGVSSNFYLAALLPHALPELLAFALVGSISIRALVNFVRYLRGGSLLDQEEIRAIVIIALCSVVILVGSAGVEAWITPAMAVPLLPPTPS